jgi:hypothetical protein
LDLPAHSPHVAPSDLPLFLHFNKYLAGQKLHDEEGMKKEVTSLLGSQAVELCDIGI